MTCNAGRARRLLTAAMLLAPFTPARAQAPVVLRDGDAGRLAGVLPADVARLNARASRATAVMRTIEAELHATVATAKGDALAFVQAGTSHFTVPPDARYSAGCSALASQAVLRPRAVFAIGKPADDVAEALRARGTTDLTGREAWALVVRQVGSSAGQARASAVAFYEARGFGIEGTVDELAVLRWKGPKRDPLWVGVHLTNVVASFGDACAALGNSALIVLSISEETRGSAAGGVAAADASSASRAERAFGAALARAGLTEDRYGALLSAAWQALRETREPSEADQTEAMSRVADLRAQADARRQNRQWMERHLATMRPLLEQYELAMGATVGR